MDYRKIIKFGGTSHVVSLPSDWIKRNNLSKGDIVYFEENGDSEITIYPKEKIKKREVKQINIDANNKSIERIRREISTAYINNFSVITIFDNNLESRSKEIRNLIHDLVALEIMGQTKNTIIARDFLNIKKISIKNLIRRTDIILRNMITDTILCIKEDHYESVKERDYDVNRLFILTNRVIRRVLEDADTAKSFGVSVVSVISLQWLFINFERIGDECKRLCRSMRNLKLTKKEKQELINLLGSINSNYIDMMKAYYNNDEELAHSIMDQKKDMINRCDNLFAKNPTIEKVMIADKLKGIEVCIKDVGKIVVKKF